MTLMFWHVSFPIWTETKLTVFNKSVVNCDQLVNHLNKLSTEIDYSVQDECVTYHIKDQAYVYAQNMSNQAHRSTPRSFTLKYMPSMLVPWKILRDITLAKQSP